MKAFRNLALFITILSAPTISYGYIGGGVGLMDEKNFGGGIVLGMGLPFNLGVDVQALGYYKNDTPVKTGWMQGNADLSYDFNFFWKQITEVIDLHPFIKGGFSYGTQVFDGGIFDSNFSYGPGYNFGGGLDWKLFSFLTIGVEVHEAILYLKGATVRGVKTVPDHTAKVFNALALVKFFAY